MIQRTHLWRAAFPVILMAAFVVYRPDQAVRVATGVVAHDVCTKVFVSGLDSGPAFAETLTRQGIRQVAWGLRYVVDRSAKAVTASLLGQASRRAEFHDGLGCVLMNGPDVPVLPSTNIAALKASLVPPLLPDIAGSTLVEPADAKLKAAFDHAFEEPAAPPYRITKAVVVVKDGRVLAERYAPGIGIDTPLHGFSMTKSVINALIGILVKQGRLTPSQPAPLAAWRDVTNPRHAITIEHLMRMTSGLALDETNSGFDASSRMLYLHGDMAAFAARAAVVAPPGTRWTYSSPSTHLLSRIIRDSVGGKPEDTLAFAWRELFGPLGMRTVTLEVNETGTVIGATYMFASARDWARFGLLYLNDGMLGDRRLLPEGWVAFSATATLDTDYGAGFWTNRSGHEYAKLRASRGIPRDAFFASGDLGQRIVVLPSQGLVIVRLGDAVEQTGDSRGVARLVSEVIEATGG